MIGCCCGFTARVGEHMNIRMAAALPLAPLAVDRGCAVELGDGRLEQPRDRRNRGRVERLRGERDVLGIRLHADIELGGDVRPHPVLGDQGRDA